MESQPQIQNSGLILKTFAHVLLGLFGRQLVFKILEHLPNIHHIGVWNMFSILTLTAPITTAADNKLCDIFLNFQKNKV